MTSGCLLQVEDTENDVILLQHAFQQADIQWPLRSVLDGQEAMDYLSGIGKYADRQKFPIPALVLLDLKLPRVMGLELLQWIRKESQIKTLPVIVLTSSGQRKDVDNAYNAGANAFVIKPSGMAELIELLKAFKVFWLRYTESPEGKGA
jgi:DNA-binding response OmpR family regulator